MRRLAALALLLGLSFGLAACGDTWKGVLQDTSDNAAAVGRGIEATGETVEDVAQ